MTETKTAPAPKSLKPCSCSLWEVGTFDGDDETAPSWTTDCSASTTRLFAQGHDAKLVSFLVRGQLDGYELRTTEGGISITFPDAAAAAGSVSPALAVKATNMLRVAKAKIDARIAREAEKANKKNAAATQEQPTEAPTEPTAQALVPVVTNLERPATIRVGRWTYAATITGNGTAKYKTKLGKEMVAGVDTYVEVA